MERKHTEQQVKYVCSNCGKEFASQLGHQYHVNKRVCLPKVSAARVRLYSGIESRKDGKEEQVAHGGRTAKCGRHNAPRCSQAKTR
jgi:transposase-like protein